MADPKTVETLAANFRPLTMQLNNSDPKGLITVLLKYLPENRNIFERLYYFALRCVSFIPYVRGNLIGRCYEKDDMWKADVLSEVFSNQLVSKLK